MDREYEIFGTLSDGSITSHGHASGLRNTRSRLIELLLSTGKEHFAIDLLAREIVFAADVSKVGPERVAHRVFHIAYTDALRIARAKQLRAAGYAVMSVVGNEAAKLVLTTLRPDNHGIGLFLVGSEAPVETRTEMIVWLKANFPGIRIVVVNPPEQSIAVPGHRVEATGPGAWLPSVTSAMPPS